MVLKVEGLICRRMPGQPPVLDGIDLALGAGEILCLLGPNGSGKTTLLQCLIGALSFERGCVRIEGETEATSRRLALQLAYVPQAAGDSALALLDVVLMGRTPHMPPLALPSREDERLAYEALARVGIERLAEHPFNRVSGGERQLALIARALAQEPVLLVMDEPTASLDFGNQIRVLEHIAELRGRGIAVLMSTHQPEHALRVADRIALLAPGGLAGIGAPAAVATPARLGALYGVGADAVAACLAPHLAAHPSTIPNPQESCPS